MPRPCPKASWRLSCPGSAQSAFVLLWSGGVIVGAADVAVDGRWDRGGGIVLRRAGGRSRPRARLSTTESGREAAPRSRAEPLYSLATNGYTIPAAAAPRIGATQNNQSCSRAQP